MQFDQYLQLQNIRLLLDIINNYNSKLGQTVLYDFSYYQSFWHTGMEIHIESNKVL